MGCTGAKEVRVNSKAPLCLRRGSFVRTLRGSVTQDYHLQEVIGDGAYGLVRKATERLTGETRAVKIIRKSILEACDLDEDFRLRELSILRSLDHPNILRVHHCYEDERNFYLVTEHCAGGPLLHKLCKRRYFSEAEVAHLLFQIMSAVAYCHGKGVVHRDIKPENVLLEDAGEEMTIRVADFGAATLLGRRKKVEGCCGTAFYVAPEVLQNVYNEKCDMWSCGIVMYVLLTGKAPYICEDSEILAHAYDARLNLDLTGFSLAARDLLSRLLCKGPTKRISATDALRHPWMDLRLTEQRKGRKLMRQLEVLREFKSSEKLKDAVRTFIATQLLSQKDMKKLAKAFMAMDTNGDGKVSRDELFSLYSFALDETVAVSEVNRIFSQVDTDCSGSIEFTEFLRASLDHRRHFSLSTLTAAFKGFDRDGDGHISLQELKQGLGCRDEHEDGLKAMIQEADLDGNGCIDLYEFAAVFGVAVSTADS